jgi:hypothetical protein
MKLGLPVKLEDTVPKPLSLKAFEASRGSALRKLRDFLDKHQKLTTRRNMRADYKSVAGDFSK